MGEVNWDGGGCQTILLRGLVGGIEEGLGE